MVASSDRGHFGKGRRRFYHIKSGRVKKNIYNIFFVGLLFSYPGLGNLSIGVYPYVVF
jgi:hypothetical protein